MIRCLFCCRDAMASFRTCVLRQARQFNCRAAIHDRGHAVCLGLCEGLLTKTLNGLSWVDSFWRVYADEPQPDLLSIDKYIYSVAVHHVDDCRWLKLHVLDSWNGCTGN